MFGCPYDILNGSHFFYTNCYGLYSYGIGQNLVNLLNKIAVPELVKHCSPEEGERIRTAFANNWKGLNQLEIDLYLPMFGFKSQQEYYKQGTVAGKMNQISVPTFCLSSDDDFCIPENLNPYKEVQAPDSNVLLATTEHGSHCSHISGKLVPEQVFQRSIVDFFNFLVNRKTLKID